jgi:hypothetical protein
MTWWAPDRRRVPRRPAVGGGLNRLPGGFSGPPGGGAQWSGDQADVEADVRRHPPQTATEGRHRRQPTQPAGRPTSRQRTPRPPTTRPMRVVRATIPGASTPNIETRQPRTSRAATTGMGATDGEDAAQDPDRLPTLPRQHPQPATCQHAHVAVTGEPAAGKLARRVRAGGRWKRTPIRAPRQRPTGAIPPPPRAVTLGSRRTFAATPAGGPTSMVAVYFMAYAVAHTSSCTPTLRCPDRCRRCLAGRTARRWCRDQPVGWRTARAALFWTD